MRTQRLNLYWMLQELYSLGQIILGRRPVDFYLISIEVNLFAVDRMFVLFGKLDLDWLDAQIFADQATHLSLVNETNISIGNL